MRGSRHPLLLSAEASCAVIVACLLAVWFRSYHVADYITVQKADVRLSQDPLQTVVGSDISLITDCGEIFLWWTHSTSNDPTVPIDGRASKWKFAHWTGEPHDETLVRFQYKNMRSAMHSPYDEHAIVISLPQWFVILLLSILTALCRALRRTGKGLHVCGSCGYDLRATPNRCPECGRDAQ
jgi:hypothetical protein